jgi:hypothetical protein
MLSQVSPGAGLEVLAIVGLVLFVVALALVSWLAWRERGCLGCLWVAVGVQQRRAGGPVEGQLWPVGWRSLRRRGRLRGRGCWRALVSRPSPGSLRQRISGQEQRQTDQHHGRDQHQDKADPAVAALSDRRLQAEWHTAFYQPLHLRVHGTEDHERGDRYV